MDYGLIRELDTTTASVHDSQVDLSREGEVVYRDKGYHGTTPKGYSAMMKRRAWDCPLSIMGKLRNIRISKKKKRAPGERQYAVIRRVFQCITRNGNHGTKGERRNDIYCFWIISKILKRRVNQNPHVSIIYFLFSRNFCLFH
ncbi:hypothetical protein C5S32_06430 [ANME-1 cluster archaeon GoMg1]|nr:hypothetical protein [ANME-1 cluster archaeon GoMg1]